MTELTFLLMIVLEVPDQTPADDDIFVTGDFNAWNTSNPLYRLKKGDDGKYRITLDLETHDCEFKFTRGTWQTVECKSDGTAIHNRSWPKDPPAECLELKVESWLDFHPDMIVEPVHTVVGDVRSVKNVYSPQLKNYRDLSVYLPPSYEKNNLQKYPVVYMHDGQNLFDEATGYAGEWQVDETCEKLAAEEGIEVIVVGVPNFGKRRLFEYSPWRDNRIKEGGDGGRYVQFLCEVVKPLIDETYRTLREAKYTSIIGSSMGGLISLYAGLSRPDIFGNIGAMSPTVSFARGEILNFLKEKNLHEGMRFYIDMGNRETEDSTVNKKLTQGAKTISEELERKGATVKFWLEPEGNHSEAQWAKRFPQTLKFLLNKE